MKSSILVGLKITRLLVLVLIAISWAGFAAAKTSATNYKIIFDVDAAVPLGDNVFRLPVLISADTVVVAVDFNFKFDSTEMRPLNVFEDASIANHVSMAWNNFFNRQLLLTSFTMRQGGFPLDVPLYYIDVKVLSGNRLRRDFFHSPEGFLNGRPAEEALERETTEGCRYVLRGPESACAGDTFCVWLTTPHDLTAPPFEGVLGMDFALDFDPAALQPTGRWTLGTVVSHGANAGQATVNAGAAGHVAASIYYGQEDSDPQLAGAGDLICIEFVAQAAFDQPSTLISASEIRESWLLDERQQCAEPHDIGLNARIGATFMVEYWQDGGRPLGFDGSGLPTHVYAASDGCERQQLLTGTDAAGSFNFDPQHGDAFQIVRDIPGKGPASPSNSCADVMSVINGLDCYMLAEITTYGATLSGTGQAPNAWQMIAGDVNMNDVLAANDVTLIQQRIAGRICDFPQVWNGQGWTASNSQNAHPASLDWRFVSANLAASQPDFEISQTFPFHDANSNDAGFHRDNVPDVPACYELSYVQDEGCPRPVEDSFAAVLLGDVDGSWRTANSAAAKTSATNYRLFLDLSRAIAIGDNVFRFPVMISADTTVVAIDFSFKFDSTQMRPVNVVEETSVASHVSMAWNNYFNRQLLLTSYTMRQGGFPLDVPVYFIDMKVLSGENLDRAFFREQAGYLNGKPAETKFEGGPTARPGAMANIASWDAALYPNPSQGQFHLRINDDEAGAATLRVLDPVGRELQRNVWDYRAGVDLFDFDLRRLAAGVYWVEVQAAGERRTFKVIKN